VKRIKYLLRKLRWWWRGGHVRIEAARHRRNGYPERALWLVDGPDVASELFRTLRTSGLGTEQQRRLLRKWAREATSPHSDLAKYWLARRVCR
jgi:hypothetical protein